MQGLSGSLDALLGRKAAPAAEPVQEFSGGYSLSGSTPSHGATQAEMEPRIAASATKDEASAQSLSEFLDSLTRMPRTARDVYGPFVDVGAGLVSGLGMPGVAQSMEDAAGSQGQDAVSSFLRRGNQALGSLAPVVASGGIAATAPLAVMGAQMASQTYYEAKQSGADETVAWTAAIEAALTGAVAGKLGSIVPNIGRLFAETGTAAQSFLQASLGDGVQQAAVGLGQKIALNVIAKGTYDKDRAILADVGQAAGDQAFLGMVLGFAVHIADTLTAAKVTPEQAAAMRQNAVNPLMDMPVAGNAPDQTGTGLMRPEESSARLMDQAGTEETQEKGHFQGQLQDTASPEATAARQNEVAPLTEAGVAHELVLPSGESLPVRYRAVEAGDLLTSHDPTQGFSRRPGGDANERDYGHPVEGRAYRETVEKIAENPRPGLLLTDTPSASDGPPIVDPGLRVLGGNARSMGMQLAYARGGENAARLKEAAMEAASRFGIDPAEIGSMEQPVIVRELSAEHAGVPGEMSRVLNAPLTTAKTANTEAISRGSKIDADTAREVSRIVGEGSLREVMNDLGATNEILVALKRSGAFSDSDIVSLRDTRGLLTQAGRDIVEQTMLGAVIGDVGALSSMPASFKGTLIRALPSLIRARTAWPEFAESLVRAVDGARDVRQAGGTAYDVKAQEFLPGFESSWKSDDRAVAIAERLLGDTPTEFARRMNTLAETLADIDSGQGDMFAPGGKLTHEQALELAVGRKIEAQSASIRPRDEPPAKDVPPQTAAKAKPEAAKKPRLMEAGIVPRGTLSSEHGNTLGPGNVPAPREAGQAAVNVPEMSRGVDEAPAGQVESGTPSPTSIKNRIVDLERQKRGLPPAMEEAARGYGKVWDEAVKALDADPHAGRDLTDELVRKPRPLTDLEDAILLHEQITTHNDIQRASDALIAASDAGDTATVAETQARLAALSDRALDVYNAGKAGGRETARGLAARRMMANEDYSLAALEVKKRAAQGGKPLSDAQRQEIIDLNQRLTDLQKRYDELESRKTIERLRRSGRPGGRRGPVVEFINKQATAARARIKARGTRALAGIDPFEAADYAIIGAEHIANGVSDFTLWSKNMLSELGEHIGPSLKDIFAQAKKFYRESLAVPLREKVQAGAEKGDIGREIQQIARSLIEHGVTSRDDLIDQVHEIVGTSLSRREIMDAISGYGDFKPLNKDEVSKRLRGLKGEMQQIAKLQDMIAHGEHPLKTGLERRIPNEAEKALIKRVNEAKKIVMADEEVARAVKTTEASIAEYERKIAANETAVAKKEPGLSSAELDALRARRDALRERLQELRDIAKPQSDAQEKALQKKIDELAARIQAKDIEPKQKGFQGPPREAIAKLKEQHAALQAELERLRKEAHPPKTKEEIALQAYKTRTAASIAHLYEKLLYKDFEPSIRKPVSLDAEALHLRAEKERALESFNRGLTEQRLKNRSRFEKSADALTKWRRAFVLSSPNVLVKLTSAGLERMVFTPLEELVGTVVVPRSVQRLAPREGGFSVKAEAKAITEGVTTGMREAWKQIRTGKSDLEAIFGKKDYMPASALDFFGHLHAALKTPVKIAEDARSFQKRIEAAMRAGLDPTDPMLQTAIAVKAYADSNQSIFLQDNRVVDAWNRAIRALEEKNKEGNVSVPGKATATAARVLLPIVRVPMNIVAETMQYAIGTVSGSVRLGLAYKRGIETLTPDQADLIARSLKKGSIGAAVLLLGYFNAESIGGYYQPGKRDEKDVNFGSMRVFGWDVPSLLLHNPLLEVLQIGATIGRVADSYRLKSDEKPQGVLAGAGRAAAGLLEEVPFAREAGDLVKMTDPQDSYHTFGHLLADIVTPQIIAWTAKKIDTDETGETVPRKPRTVLENLEYGIPGLRQNVPTADDRKAETKAKQKKARELARERRN